MAHQPLSFVQLRLVALAVLIMLTDGYDNQAIGYAAPAIAESWHVAHGVFGPVFSAGVLGLAAGAFLFAPLADRFGGRRVLIGCVAWYAALSVATAFVHDVASLTAVRFLTGLGMGGAMPTAIALVSDNAPPHRRTLLITLAVCGFALGGAFGGLIASLAMDRLGWSSVFLLGGVVPILLLPCLALWLPKRPVGEAHVREKMPVKGLFVRGYAVPTLLIWLAFFMNLVMLYLLSNWLPLVMRGAGFSISLSSLGIAFYQGGGSIGALVLAFLADRGRPQAVLAGAFAGAALALILLSVVGPQTGVLMAVIAVVGFFVVGGQIAANAFAGAFYPLGVRATGVGWALGIGRVGSISGPLLGGALLTSGASMSTVFQVCAVPAVIAASAILLVRRPAGEG